MSTPTRVRPALRAKGRKNSSQAIGLPATRLLPNVTNASPSRLKTRAHSLANPPRYRTYSATIKARVKLTSEISCTTESASQSPVWSRSRASRTLSLSVPRVRRSAAASSAFRNPSANISRLRLRTYFCAPQYGGDVMIRSTEFLGSPVAAASARRPRMRGRPYGVTCESSDTRAMFNCTRSANA